jgi:PAS domain S-box-containing protein
VIEFAGDRTVRYWNPAAERIFGWSAAEVLGRPNPIVPDDEWDDHVARTTTLLAEGGEIDAVRRRLRSDGEPVDVRIHCTPLADSDGMVVIAEDVTDRVRAEEQLRKTQEMHLRVIENIGDVISLIDREGNVVFSSIGDALGGRLTSDEEPGWFGLRLHPDDLPAAEQRIAAAFAGAEPELLQVRIRHDDGSWRIFEGLATCLRDERDAPEFVLSVARDVTERSRLEFDLAQAQRLEAVGRLSAGIAHDFNNLLTAITGYAQLSLGWLGDREPDTRRALKQIADGTERGARLVQQLLAFSRQQFLQPSLLDLNAVVGRLRELLERVLGEHVVLRFELGENVPTVWADDGQIEQAILNLALNSRDAMPGGGLLTIRTGGAELAAGSYAVVSVEDDGEGMDDETRSHIFEPFFTTKQVGKGTGLGLASVYGVTQQSGGLIEVESEPGQGSTFRIFLPTAPGS